METETRDSRSFPQGHTDVLARSGDHFCDLTVKLVLLTCNVQYTLYNYTYRNKLVGKRNVILDFDTDSQSMFPMVS